MWNSVLRISLILAAFAVPGSQSPNDAGQPARQKARYEIFDLGTLPECNVTNAESVNDEKWVVGLAYAGAGHGISMTARPFLWRGGKIMELPSLGASFGQALSINSRGDIGGWSESHDGDRPVVWKRLNGFQPLRLSSSSGQVMRLLDDGTAVGYVYLDGGFRAAVWRDGHQTIIGDPSNAETVANAAMNTKLVVGHFVPKNGLHQNIRSEGDRHACCWRDGKQIPLPELGAGHSDCTDVNARGDMVGWADSTTGRAPCLWTQDGVKRLEMPQNFYGEAHSINSAGDIVGQAVEFSPGRDWHASIWRNGKEENLNKLIDPNSGWKLTIASHITDKGIISGYGHFEKAPNDSWRAFVLVPIAR